MKLATRRTLVLVGVSAALLGLGAGIAVGLGDALGISSEPAVGIPTESLTVAPDAATILPPEFTSIDAPDSLRTNTAVGELRDAVASAPATVGQASLTVSYADEGDDQSYTLSGSPTQLTITAQSEAGAVLGIYDLAAAVRDGRPFANGTVDSALNFRMVDLGAVGVDPDVDAYTAGDDYSHNSNAFADVIVSDAPYIDRAALVSATEEFEAYVRHTLAEGYNAIAVPGFIEYLQFDGVGSGTDVYAADDTHRARAVAMRDAFGPMLQYAHDLGMKVYFRTDMLALTTPLEAYFTARFGGLDTESTEFWDVYRAGLDELYEAMPYVDGVVIRIGEAGRVYDLPGWDYYSELAVTSVDAVRAMLTTFSDQAERAGKEVIFRSWSVGVGAVGDMHTDPASYAAVLDGLDSPALVVSTKYSLGDFYSYMPLNVTLDAGTQRRIIEFQSRREFEAFGSLPNDLGSLYQTAIKHFIAANPNVEGIWTWTQDGGPWRAGPMTLELNAGFWQLYELNTELAVRLARDPGADPAALTADWARQWFSSDPATVTAIGEVMAQSRAAVTSGLYIGPFASQRVAAIGLHPPPMMWIFEWDILTGDSAVLDVIYSVSKPELDAALAGAADAVATAKAQQATLATTDPSQWKDPRLQAHFADTLAYQVNLFETLGSYRTMVLRHAEWLDTGSATAYSEWETAKAAWDVASADHEATYGGDVDLPAYNLTAARLGVERASLDLPMAWAARILLTLLVLWLALGALGRFGFTRRVPGAAAARATWLSGTRPWRSADAVAQLSRASKVLLVVLPIAVLALSRGIFTWFASPAHFFFTSAAWLVFVVGIALILRERSPWAVVATVGGAILLRAVLLLAVLAVRGPGFYWFGFWTDPVSRSLYVTVAFALFAWVPIAAAWALAGQVGRRRAIGAVLAACGLVLALLGGFVAAVGLEGALTLWNDQMALLPWGLSRILGLTVYLEIPAESPFIVAGLGVLMLAVGSALAARWKRAR